MPDARTETSRTDPPGNVGTVTPPADYTDDAAQLAGIIRAGDLPAEAPQAFGLAQLGEPLPAYLAAIDRDHDTYETLRPGPEVNGLGVAALDTWRAADAAVLAAYGDAHDGPGMIQAATRADEAAAIDAVTNATKLAAPTRPAVEAKTIEAARRYRACLAVALDAIGTLRDALRDEWRTGPWRARAIGTIRIDEVDALAARDAFAAAMAKLQRDRLALISIDKSYGVPAYDGEVLMADLDDARARLSPPPWNGLSVAQVLAGQVGDMNRRATNPGSLADAERFVLADIVNTRYTPTATDAPTTAV